MEKQCAAFFSGLSEIIPARSLKMFNQAELRMLVGSSSSPPEMIKADDDFAGGVDQAIDLDDLRLNTVYGGWEGDEANDTIRDFWSVVESFDKDDRGKLVKFVTSCARPPLLGFSELDPRFAIRNAGTDETRLPTRFVVSFLARFRSLMMIIVVLRASIYSSCRRTRTGRISRR